jgi:hypothetical protein
VVRYRGSWGKYYNNKLQIPESEQTADGSNRVKNSNVLTIPYVVPLGKKWHSTMFRQYPKVRSFRNMSIHFSRLLPSTG